MWSFKNILILFRFDFMSKTTQKTCVTCLYCTKISFSVLNPHISHPLHHKTLVYPKIIVYELFGFFIFMAREWFTIFHERLKYFVHKTNFPLKYLRYLKAQNAIGLVTPCTLTQSVDSKLTLLYKYLFF